MSDKDTIHSGLARRTKLREAAGFVAFLGVLFWLSPLLNIFGHGRAPNVLTNTVAYILIIWAVLVIITRYLSRLLIADETSDEEES